MRCDLAGTSGVSALAIVLEHKKIAFSNGARLRSGWLKLRDFEELSDDDKACIQEISTREDTRSIEGVLVTETWVKVKLYDKQKSLDALSGMLGYNAPIRQEIVDRTVSAKMLNGLSDDMRVALLAIAEGDE